MGSACQQEIIELHRFFVDWFTGILPKEKAVFKRLTDVLAAEMVLISPAGATQTREQIVAWIWEAHSSRAAMSPPFRIWIEDFQTRQVGGNLTLATYEEWQEVDGQVTARLSSALFQNKDSTPNALEWIHVHETWLFKP